MPRCARIKTKHSIYHVIVRSISELMLFKDRNDKIEYVSIIKKYQKLFGFKIYAYCLMDNHAHFIIYSNGADISKIMHNINFLYAQKFNHKYQRHGHLFQDRFKSKIISDEKYLLALTAYIHNNPKDLADYDKNPEEYEFSSLSAYLSGKRDKNRILDCMYVNGLLNKNNFRNKKIYNNILKYKTDDKGNIDCELKKSKFLHNGKNIEKLEGLKLDDVINRITSLIEIDPLKLKFKYIRHNTEKRILFILLLRSVFDKNHREISEILGNISIGRISMLTTQGVSLIGQDIIFRNKFKKYSKLLSF